MPIFYHGTTQKRWAQILSEGVLWGKHGWDGEGNYRYTYLTPDREVAERFGPVVLMVEYSPVGPPHDNYGFDPPTGQHCWQFSVFDPILLENVRIYSGKENDD